MILAAGCGAIVPGAPFPHSPLTTQSGDLLGPYTGVVIDTETEKAVTGALVVGTWTFARGLGAAAPRGSHEAWAKTDSEGRYELPRLEEIPGGLSTRVSAFQLVIYKRGYVGYRSDHVFPDGAVRSDFAQVGNLVRLDKTDDQLSHMQHLAFLGGNALIRKAAAWEAVAAADEARRAAERASPGAAATALLDVSRLLTEDEIKARTGWKGKFVVGRLTDAPRSPVYDSLHFRAEERGEHYDVAVKVWVLGPTQAAEEYRKLIGGLPNVRPSEDAGTRSFRAGEGDLLAVVFVDEPTGILAQVTCGIAQCREHGTVGQLAKLAAARLSTLEVPR